MSEQPDDAPPFPPFNPYGTCPKCLSSNVSMKFRAAGGCLHNLGVHSEHQLISPSSEVEGDPTEVIDQNPRMCRICERCNYGWDESTADVAVAGPTVLIPHVQYPNGTAWSGNPATGASSSEGPMVESEPEGEEPPE